MIPCIIFDIDGTIANGDHRLHLIKQQPKQWDAYFSLCSEDVPIAHMVRILRALERQFATVLVTGRPERCRTDTVHWLCANACRHPFHLYMRPDGDHRDDDVLKIELLAKVRADGFEPLIVFEDRSRVVRAWRAAGVPCAQVQEGDF